MSTPFTIDIWADISCPFCFLGWQRLDQALKTMPEVTEVAVNWHSFQLNPDLKPVEGEDIFDYLANHKSQTREWALEAHKQVKEQGLEVGIEFNFDDIVVANTAKAHELIKYAEQQGAGHQMMLALLRAYFLDGQDVADSASLIEIARAQQLNVDEVKEVLTSRKMLPAVKQDIDLAFQMQVSGVPFFVLNRQLAVSGAQSADTFKQAIKKAMSS